VRGNRWEGAEMSTARVDRGTPADTETRGSSPCDREPAGAEGSTSGAGSAGGCGAHQPGPLGARGHRSAAHPPKMPAHTPETPPIAVHGRRIIDTDMRVPPESGESNSSAPCAITRRRPVVALLAAPRWTCHLGAAMDIGLHRPHQQGEALMPSKI
jgi:hypothetical protein